MLMGERKEEHEELLLLDAPWPTGSWIQELEDYMGAPDFFLNVFEVLVDKCQLTSLLEPTLSEPFKKIQLMLHHAAPAFCHSF